MLAAGKLSGKVISTGGGVVVNDDNFDALKQNGMIIFLNRSTSYLPTDGRPLSQSNDLNEMLKKDFRFTENSAILRRTEMTR